MRFIHLLLVTLTSLALGLDSEHGFLRDVVQQDISLVQDKSCDAHTTCGECTTASSWCHWCSHDQACHAKGSWHGCAIGVSCDNEKNSTDKKEGCDSYTDCSSCALSSYHCHWCAHDNMCHSVGSPYGCVSGVDCFSNDRCRRRQSESLDEFVMFDIGLMPLVLIIVAALGMCLCASLCFCVAKGVKGAYDDLHDAGRRNDDLEVPLLVRHPNLSNDAESHDTEVQSNVNVATPADEVAAAPTVATETSAYHSASGNIDDDSIHDDENVSELRNLPPSSSYSDRIQRPRRSRHMQGLFNMCTACYVINLSLIGLFVFGSIRYFPKKPIYNICNDAVAWGSLIDSFTSLKPAADFEILGSISNPNHLGARLLGGRGSFKHNGAFVGTFDIPPFDADAMSISDFMIIAHIDAEKWEALSLAAEYYRGKLVLHIDTHVSIQIPALGGYTLEADVKDMVVNVNEMSDRSLCACPDWNSAKNKTKPMAIVDYFNSQVE